MPGAESGQVGLDTKWMTGTQHPGVQVAGARRPSGRG